MDRYDDLLIKAREEMMGKQPLRKGRDSKQLFSQVWEQVIKAPQYTQEQMDSYNRIAELQQQRQAQERQQANMSRTMAPQPADPFGQMNEGASLDSAGQQPPTGMFSNFRQGRSETRDPNKTGMFGRAKQGISNFMNMFRRKPAEQETAQGTVESASGSPPTMEEMMGKQPLRKGRDSKQLFSQVWEQVVKAPQNDPYGLMDSFAQQRQEQQRQARGNFNTMAPQPADPFGQMNEGASLESAGQQPPTGMFSNFRQGRSETRDPNKTGMFGRAKQGISNFMNMFRRKPAEQETAQGTVESASGSPPTMEEMKPTREPLGAAESYRRAWGKEPDEQWLMQNDPDELQRRQAQQQEVRSTPPSIANKYRDVDPKSPSSRLAEMREEMGGRAAPTTPSSMQSIYDRINNDMKPIEPQQTSPTEAGLNQMKITEFTQPKRDLDAELREFGIDSQGERVEPPQEMEETKPMTDRQREIEALAGSGKQDQLREMLEAEQTDEPSVDEMTTTQTGTRLPKGALPMKRRPESRMLPENVESREAQPMGGIKRRTFDEVNNRSQEQKDAQHPEARYADGRLKQKNRRKKTREKYSYEQPEEPKPPKKAKKGSAAKAVKTTAAKRKAKVEKPTIEGTQEMREEAPPKKKTGGTKAQKGKKPVKEDIEGAQVMQEPAKSKESAKKLVENTTKGKEVKAKGQGVKPFPNKPAQKARTRPKNEKKEGVNEANEVAAKARSERRKEAKKKEAVSEPEEKTYTRYISGSTDKDYVNEVVNAAKAGNASAISRLRNDKADLVDHHGFSDDEIDEITG